MKKEARLLLEKGINSLILGVEHFNRPSDRGRIESVLIFLDHSFEMLLKASILHRGGKIREPRAKQTIGFDACVRKALSDGNIKFLTREQALTLQAINSLRDAAQHHLVDLSEQHLYLHAQSGVTLFRDLQKTVFGRELTLDLPDECFRYPRSLQLTLRRSLTQKSSTSKHFSDRGVGDASRHMPDFAASPFLRDRYREKEFSLGPEI